MHTHKPFLCLGMRKLPPPQLGSNHKPRAEPVVYLRYVPSRKAYALLTLPNLYLIFDLNVRFFTMTFPLRVTDHLTKQMDTFLRPTAEDEAYRSIHGPSNILRQMRRSHQQPVDPSSLLQEAPVEVSALSGPVPPPGYSRVRGYNPSAAALENLASINAHSSVALYTPDQLAARTPRNTAQALSGPDAAYWIPAIVKDYDMIRDKKCIKNVTSRKPDGANPPGVEQRFKIKYRDEEPVALTPSSPNSSRPGPCVVATASATESTSTQRLPQSCTPRHSKCSWHGPWPRASICFSSMRLLLSTATTWTYRASSSSCHPASTLSLESCVL